MKDGKIIAHTRRDRNLFTFDVAMLGQVMSTISKAMAITGRSWPTHFVGQNKYIHLWHRQLAHASNVRVVRASKLVEGIDLGPEKEYNLAEVFVDSEK